MIGQSKKVIHRFRFLINHVQRAQKQEQYYQAGASISRSSITGSSFTWSVQGGRAISCHFSTPVSICRWGGGGCNRARPQTCVRRWPLLGQRTLLRGPWVRTGPYAVALSAYMVVSPLVQYEEHVGPGPGLTWFWDVVPEGFVEAVVRPHDLGIQTLLVLLEERWVATQPGEETDNSFTALQICQGVFYVEAQSSRQLRPKTDSPLHSGSASFLN